MRPQRSLATAAAVAAAILICPLGTEHAAGKEYAVRFKSSSIEVLFPGHNRMEFEDVVRISGRIYAPVIEHTVGRIHAPAPEQTVDRIHAPAPDQSVDPTPSPVRAEQVWICLRGPRGEVVTYPATVRDGTFTCDVWLRFGPGVYTVWAGESQAYFDGSIRFEVVNTGTRDLRYIAPSAYVDSSNPVIVALAESIHGSHHTAEARLRAIYDWVTTNIMFDYDAYEKGDNVLNPASAVLSSRTGTCRDYAFLVAALARAMRLEAQVVYGAVENEPKWNTGLHAWNVVYTGDRWMIIDAAWGSGYIKDHKFVHAPTDEFFDIAGRPEGRHYIPGSITFH